MPAYSLDTSNLDAALRVEMRAELSALHRRLGTTMIYVTHDQTEAMTLGTRIAVLSGGILQQVDTPLTLFDKPVNRFVAGFIGSPKMNFIEAKLSADGSSFETSLGPIKNPWTESLGLDPHGSLTLGIRPAHVSVSRSTDAGDFQAKVTMMEPMGWETRVHMNVGDGVLMAQHTGQGLEGLGSGDCASFKLDTTELYVFGANGQTVAFPTRIQDS